LAAAQLSSNGVISIPEGWVDAFSPFLVLQPRQPLPGILKLGKAAMIRKLYEVDSMICPQ
jgi:hypothetical protein